MTDTNTLLTQLAEAIRIEERGKLLVALNNASVDIDSAAAKATKAAMKDFAAAAAAAPKAKRVVARAARAAGTKRSAEDIEKTANAILVFVNENPGSGAEAIRKALDVDLKTIELPIKKLLASKSIKKRGVKRATKYYSA